MHFCRAAITAGDEAEENLGEKTPLLRCQPSHDAEIYRDQLAGIVDEQISRMHVGVEETVPQGMAQERLDDGGGEAFEIEPLGFELCAVRERRRLDPFQREHPARGAVPVHGGHAKVRIVSGLLCHLRERGRLEAQIHFDGDGTPQRVHHLD